MNKNTDEEITKRDRFNMFLAIISLVFVNFFLLNMFYQDGYHFLVLLAVLIELGAYFYIHFSFKDKLSPKDFFNNKIGGALCAFVVGFLFLAMCLSAYLNNVLEVSLGIFLLLSILIHLPMYDGKSEYLL